MPDPKRREFLKGAATVGIGGLLALPPGVAGLKVFLDPLARAPASPTIPIASLEALPADGRPARFTVLADRTDAWNHSSGVPIGSVYLRRIGSDKVQAFNASCPHLGCLVQPAADGAFVCPCHDSRFTADGQIDRSRGGKIPSPRGMDVLEANVEGDVVRVRFQNFRAGIPEKIPVT